MLGSLFYMITAAKVYSRKLGQRPILAGKSTFYENKGTKIVLHLNKDFNNFHKRGQCLITGHIKGLDKGQATMFTFFSTRFLNMYMPRTTFYLLWWAYPPGLAFHGSGLACLPSWLGMVNVGWLCSMRSEIFLQMKFIIFQGCPTKQVAFLPGQLSP